MTDDKKKCLEEAGFEFGDAEDFLELTPRERRLVDEAFRRMSHRFWTGVMFMAVLTVGFCWLLLRRLLSH